LRCETIAVTVSYSVSGRHLTSSSLSGSLWRILLKKLLLIVDLHAILTHFCNLEMIRRKQRD
jgi:hypothetical protein